MSEDLRAFLNKLNSQDLWRIDHAVALEYEMTAYALELERRGDPPVLLFSNVSGFNAPVVSNIFASRKRLAMALNLSEDSLLSGWSCVSQNRIKPWRVDQAPVKQVISRGADIDLMRYPIPLHFESDGGRYITGGVVIARHPETGVGNLNFTRLQVQGAATLGASLHSRGDLWRFHQIQQSRGQPLEVVVAIGVHPALSIAAATQLPIDEDEMELAGGLIGKPVDVIQAESIDLLVPADAEMLIEGYLEPDLQQDEGPFGEYTGYSTDRSTRNVLRVTAITHRQDMIYQDVVPGASTEHLNLSKTSRVPRVFEALKKTFPNVVDIHYPYSGTHFHCYVSMHKPLPGQVRQLMLLLFGLDMYVKLVVVVDDDIDVHNEQEILWALATRFQADRDALVIEGVSCNLLDPSASQGVSAKMGLDATTPPGMTAKRMTLPQDVQEKVRKEISARGG